MVPPGKGCLEVDRDWGFKKEGGGEIDGSASAETTALLHDGGNVPPQELGKHGPSLLV